MRLEAHRGSRSRSPSTHNPVKESSRARASRRRHLRALPAVPRAAARPSRSATASRSARPRAVVQSVFGMLEDGATHLGVATDHVDRVVPQRSLGRLQGRRRHRSELLRRSSRCSRTSLARARASRCGRWSTSRPTTRSRRRRTVAAADDRVEQVIICTPDKDLGQCVGGKVVQLDRRQRDLARRRRRAARSSACRPSRSPTGSRSSATRADGFPGLPGSGAKTAAARAAPVRATSKRSPTTPRRGTSRTARRRPARGDARGRARASRIGSRCWRRCAPTPTSAPSTTGSGRGPTPELRSMVRTLRLAATARHAAAKLATQTRSEIVSDAVLSRRCGPASRSSR